MLDDLQAISKAKAKFIEARLSVLQGAVNESQRKLFDALFSKVIKELTVAEGDIENTAGNRAAIAKLDGVFDSFQSEMMKLTGGVVRDYQGIFNYNNRYFEKFAKDTFPKVRAGVRASMEGLIGLKGDKPVKNGFLDSFIRDTALARKLKQQILSSVMTGKPISELTRSINEVVTGTTKTSGLLQTHFQGYIYDTYSQFDRESSNLFSIELELNHGVYAGGVVENSREFCIIRHEKVFSRSEIAKFGTSRDAFGGYTDKAKGEFAGKWSKNQNRVYDPFRDMGCNRCGHTWNWISYSLAKTLRPGVPKE